MLNTKVGRRKFQGDPKAFSETSRLKWLGFLSGVVGIVIAIWFKNDPDISRLFREIDINRDTQDFLLNLWIFAEIPYMIFSFWNSMQVENRLKSTYVTVDEDKVRGVHFNDHKTAVPFEVSYADINEAAILPLDAKEHKGNNVRIWTKRGTYDLYAIEEKATVVQMINERRILFEQKEKLANVQQMVTPTVTSEEGTRFCMYCGTAFPEEAKFCPKCGKAQG